MKKRLRVKLGLLRTRDLRGFIPVSWYARGLVPGSSPWDTDEGFLLRLYCAVLWRLEHYERRART